MNETAKYDNYIKQVFLRLENQQNLLTNSAVCREY